MNSIARLIFTTYVFPFEVTSALLITAALGAMVLAHRERLEPKLTQRDLSRLRTASGRPAPLSGPGTYARHNAVDMPALLPDGSPAENSVSPFVSHRIAPPGTEVGGRALADEQRTLLGSGRSGRGAGMSPGDFVALAVVLFVIGAVGVLVRRNAMVIFMCVELMLNAVNLAFVAFARMHNNLGGQVIAFFVMVVAAAEVVVGLAILMSIFRARRSASVDDASLLKY